jgi:hypothetical protein
MKPNVMKSINRKEAKSMTDKNTTVILYNFGLGDDDGFSLVATPTCATSRPKFLDFKQGALLLGAEARRFRSEPKGLSTWPLKFGRGWSPVNRLDAFRGCPANGFPPAVSSVISISQNGRFTMTGSVILGSCRTNC